jgi:hypothetical protein
MQQRKDILLGATTQKRPPTIFLSLNRHEEGVHIKVAHISHEVQLGDSLPCPCMGGSNESLWKISPVLRQEWRQMPQLRSRDLEQAIERG